jgi:hypothetical protein
LEARATHSGGQVQEQKINCFKCRYFVITWQKERAYACRAMGFKSRLMPNVVVRRLSGEACRLFTPKPAKSAGKN